KSADLVPADTPRDAIKRLYAAAEKLLEARNEELTASEFYLKGRCAEELGETDKALRSYKIAIDMTLTENDWRLRYARLLHRANKFPEARREIRELLKLMGDRPDIRDELDTIEREIQISEWPHVRASRRPEGLCGASGVGTARLVYRRQSHNGFD